MISGKIIPTILTSTASIAGIASLQIFTLLQTHDIKYIRKCFFNLGRVEFILENPSKPNYKKDQKENKIIGEKYGIDVDILSCGDIILINTILPSHIKSLDRKLEDIYNEKAKFKLENNYMIIDVVASISDIEIDGEKIEYASADIPEIKYIFK